MISGDRLPLLDAERVRLRWLSRADVDDLFTLFSDAEALRYWSHLPFTTRTEAKNYLIGNHAGFARHTLYQWGIAHKETNRVIGTCTLFHLDPHNQRAEVGYMLGRPWWGQGYAREAVNRLLAYAFGPLNLHRLEADTHPENAHSLRLLERLGFQREGYMRERWIVGGEVSDSVVLGLLRRDWEAQQTPPADPPA